MSPAPASIEYRAYSGMNIAALPTSAMRSDELALIVNGEVRTGFLRTRPGWQWQPLSFYTKDAQLLFETGKYQGSEFFLSDFGTVICYAVEGSVFAVDPLTGGVKKIDEGAMAAFSKFSDHVFLKQRNRWMVAQDGISAPLVSDGLSVTQKRDPKGIPIGTIMAEGWHRLFVVSPDRRRIYASDHEMDPNSTPISFTENTDYYANSRYFEGPPTLGRIMGAAFVPYQDSSTGIGPLLVFFEKGVRAYNVAVARSQWILQDISQTILPSVGSCSHFAYAAKGGELVFRDQDGRIRTIRNAQQFQATNANFSNDFGISPLLANEDTSLRAFSQAVTFDKRTLVLTHPERVYLADQRVIVRHKGIAVMEHESPTDKQDVWSFWTGMNICGLDVGPVGGEEVLIAFCRDDDGKNRLYRLSRDAKFDTVPKGGGEVDKRIQMTFSTPYLDFSSVASIKKLTGAGMRLNRERGRIDITGRWQADGKQPSKWFSHAELHPQCLVMQDCKLTEMADGSNPRLSLPALPEADQSFYKGSAIFDVFGSVQVEEMYLAAAIQEAAATTNASCTPKQTRGAQVACEVDIFAYDAFNAPVTEPTDLKPCNP